MNKLNQDLINKNYFDLLERNLKIEIAYRNLIFNIYNYEVMNDLNNLFLQLDNEIYQLRFKELNDIQREQFDNFNINMLKTLKLL